MGVNTYNKNIVGATQRPPPHGTPLRCPGGCRPRAPAPRALRHRAPLQSIHMLAEATEPVCVCDFTAAFDLGQPTISHHLAKLRDARLITSTRRGIWTFHDVNGARPPAAREVVALLH